MDILLVAKIHQHIFADTFNPKDRPYSDLAYNLEAAIREKNVRYLLSILANGKGFNDKSKEVFCDIIDIPRVYLLKEIKAAIANHCGCSVDSIDLHEQYHAALRLFERRQKELNDKFANAEEIVQMIEQKIASGYTRVGTENRKTFLINEQTNMGWPLNRTQIKEYAKAKLELMDVEKQYHSSEYRTLFGVVAA
ncbi:hypothetical protein ACA544_02230 [Vibrio cholerae]|uniref:hypothetical protein n=1 Tax=Vibrio cholerae TaxID=666 RepID=UPI003A0FC64C